MNASHISLIIWRRVDRLTFPPIPHTIVLLLPTETPLAVRRQQLVRSLQVRSISELEKGTNHVHACMYVDSKSLIHPHPHTPHACVHVTHHSNSFIHPHPHIPTQQILGLIYASEPLLTFVYIRHMTRLASNGVRNLKVRVRMN